MEETKEFKSGFVNIIGRPNVGKSTLLNALMNEKIAITSSKAQTTRHRMFGILNDDSYQIVFSDTPGAIDPAYKLQEKMMGYVRTALDDADVILFMVALEDKNEYPELIDMALRAQAPVVFLINKTDQNKGSQTFDKTAYWKELYPELEVMSISALDQHGTNELLNRILELLPNHPAYFPEDEITDKSERFICAEIIREKIFMNYQQEIPYSSEVVVTSFKEEEKIIHIDAEIFVERDSQKGIIIGKKAESIKKVGMEARKDMESFFGKKIHLQTFVKVEKDWRKDDRKLSRFGY
ncbi:GTP-binding protein Era [Ekhidna lutea]|uniref:GTPase Era n=1 Tax=Ekhidna lutea TaxID=447679 RepID=A0A239JZD9_EKHLU|nr:GTPase Era [Ekhidna lutea]SNT11170.1 GTP-binding protein Era [Ekhidna lutea]